MLTSRSASLALSLIILSQLASQIYGATSGFQVETQLLFVRYDGRVELSMNLIPIASQTSISVLLLSDVIKSLIVLDASNQPLPFSLSGRNLTIYAQGATMVSIHYSSDALTSKLNETWTLAFNTPYNATVLMPAGADLLSVKPKPRAITVEANQTVLDLFPDSYTITYTLNPPSENQAPTSIFSWLLGPGLPYVAGILAVLGTLGGYLLLRRRHKIVEQYQEVRPEDRAVLEYIAKKGGSAMLSEIRARFNLSKSSSWRMARRLERKGMVRSVKIDSQIRLDLEK